MFSSEEEEVCSGVDSGVGSGDGSEGESVADFSDACCVAGGDTWLVAGVIDRDRSGRAPGYSSSASSS